MFKGRSKSQFRGRNGPAGAQKVPLKGLFTDGVWHCNCDPRLPAQHFQTKNGGKNHGRWCTLQIRLTEGSLANLGLL